MLFLCLALAVTVSQQAPTPLSSIQVSPGKAATLDISKLKGPFIRQLAWSPDATELYLMTYEANRDASVKKTFHYVIPVATGVPKAIETQPAWAAEYWTWKSGQASPDDPALKIDLSTAKKREDAVALPMGGDLARGGTGGSVAGAGGGLSQEEAMAASRAMQTNDVYTMKLKGEVIGEWINHPTLPGQTYGWAPKGTALIAYAEQKSGKLVLMNTAGEKKNIDGTRDVVFPAWSNDGTRLAYLEGRGRNRFALVVASVQK
jgi:hypothetical protein